MSGIVGSSHNIRGSGIVAKLGTDGQVFTSAGAGLSQTFEDAAGGGKLGQVVQAVKRDEFETTSTSFADITGMTIDTGTLASTSSKVLVHFSITGSIENGYPWHLKLIRGTTAIADADAASNRVPQTVHIYGQANLEIETASMTYLDSPSTTSATTYKIQSKVQDGNYPGQINRSKTDTDNTAVGRTISSITAIEILV